MLKDAAVKVQYKQSIEAQLDQYVDIVDFRLYLVYYYSNSFYLMFFYCLYDYYSLCLWCWSVMVVVIII